MKTIKDWQRDAHALAVEKGFHSRECPRCGGKQYITDRTVEIAMWCPECNGTGRVPVDPHSPTRIAARLALIHCEISEAVECVARGERHMRLHWVANGCVVEDVADGCFRAGPWKPGQAKPEGFPIELSDVFLRLCDLAESLGLELENHEVSARLSAPCGRTPEELAAALCLLHDALPYAYEASDEKDEAGLNDALGTLQWIAVSTGVDLLACAELKMEYNKTRPIMHGGKVL